MTEHSRLDPAHQSGAMFDELLVVMVQQGDEKALRQLHKRWNTRLARAALRFTGDADQARDLVQESWLGIWKGIARLRDPSRFRSFAFSVLHRRGTDFVRRTIRDRNASRPLDERDTQGHAIAAGQDEKLALHQAFSALPPDQRLAAHLYFVEGLALREIADVQDIAEGTAKSRLFHARRKLKAALGDPSPEPIEGEPA